MEAPMSTIQIHMFGKFEMVVDNRSVNCFRCQKALELFCYLILFCDRPHNREQLAEMFWGEHSTVDSKRYLRKILWQLQSELELVLDPSCSHLIQVEQDWLRFNGYGNVRIDVLEFERLITTISGKPGEELDEQTFHVAQEMEDFYRGDLLEGWYQDWCIFERERLKDAYIALVDKLMAYCEAHSNYERGIHFGWKLLAMDRAHESTYQRMIRLFINSGDRISALRVFEACREALKNEFDIEPGKTTLDLYELIKTGGNYPENVDKELFYQSLDHMDSAILGALLQIKKVICAQASEQQKILTEIHAIEETLARR
jgi:DNA-binding SARP family transcriptional activator